MTKDAVVRQNNPFFSGWNKAAENRVLRDMTGIVWN